MRNNSQFTIQERFTLTRQTRISRSMGDAAAPKKGPIIRPLQIHKFTNSAWLENSAATFQDSSSKSAQAPRSARC